MEDPVRASWSTRMANSPQSIVVTERPIQSHGICAELFLIAFQRRRGNKKAIRLVWMYCRIVSVVISSQYGRFTRLCHATYSTGVG